MKLAPREIERYATQITNAQKAALIFGDDRGAIREYATRIAKAVVDDLGDPFRIALLDASSLSDDPQRLGDELGALSLMGGRRLVWLRDASERQRNALENAWEGLVAQPGETAFLLIEAGELTYKSTLRQFFEEQRAAIAVNCESGQAGDLEALIRGAISTTKRNISPDAEALLADRLGPDRALARAALDTLVLYVASAPPNAPITVEDIFASVPDASETELDQVLDPLLDGARAELDQALTRSFAGGASAIGLIRIAQRNFQRLHWVLSQAENNQGVEGAIARLRPPLPRHVQSAFAARCRSWKLRTVERVLQRLLQAEIQCKTTALPEDTICANLFMAIAGQRGR